MKVKCAYRRNNGGRTCQQVHRSYFEFWCSLCCTRFDHRNGRHSDPEEDCELCFPPPPKTVTKAS